MKFSFGIFLFLLSSPVFSQDVALTQNPVTGSVLSIRCKELHIDRNLKIKNQQKLNALLKRNQLLQKKTPASKELMNAKLKANQIKIKNELQLANFNIESLEETIIRTGCPGLSL